MTLTLTLYLPSGRPMVFIVAFTVSILELNLPSRGFIAVQSIITWPRLFLTLYWAASSCTDAVLVIDEPLAVISKEVFISTVEGTDTLITDGWGESVNKRTLCTVFDWHLNEQSFPAGLLLPAIWYVPAPDVILGSIPGPWNGASRPLCVLWQSWQPAIGLINCHPGFST